MKKYKEFIFEKLNINNFIQEYNFITPELERFWSRLVEKLDIEEFDKINNRNSAEVFAFNEKVRAERKAKRNKHKKTIEPEVEKPKQKTPEMTDRKLQFSRDSDEQLISKVNNTEYKKYVKDINTILHNRKIKKQKQAEKQKQLQKQKQPELVEKKI